MPYDVFKNSHKDIFGALRTKENRVTHGGKAISVLMLLLFTIVAIGHCWLKTHGNRLYRETLFTSLELLNFYLYHLAMSSCSSAIWDICNISSVHFFSSFFCSEICTPFSWNTSQYSGYLNWMVTRKHKAGAKENRCFLKTNFRYVTALDLDKCLKKIKQSTC